MSDNAAHNGTAYLQILEPLLNNKADSVSVGGVSYWKDETRNAWRGEPKAGNILIVIKHDNHAVTYKGHWDGPGKIEEPIGEATSNYHHVNTTAWHGKGTAIVFCPGQAKFDKCSLNGDRWALHGSRDKGRYVYTDYNSPRLHGVLECYRGNDLHQYEIPRKSGVIYGDCK